MKHTFYAKTFGMSTFANWTWKGRDPATKPAALPQRARLMRGGEFHGGDVARGATSVRGTLRVIE